MTKSNRSKLLQKLAKMPEDHEMILTDKGNRMNEINFIIICNDEFIMRYTLAEKYALKDGE